MQRADADSYNMFGRADDWAAPAQAWPPASGAQGPQPGNRRSSLRGGSAGGGPGAGGPNRSDPWPASSSSAHTGTPGSEAARKEDSYSEAVATPGMADGDPRRLSGAGLPAAAAAGAVSDRYRNKHQIQTFNIFSQFDDSMENNQPHTTGRASVAGNSVLSHHRPDATHALHIHALSDGMRAAGAAGDGGGGSSAYRPNRSMDATSAGREGEPEPLDDDYTMIGGAADGSMDEALNSADYRTSEAGTPGRPRSAAQPSQHRIRFADDGPALRAVDLEANDDGAMQSSGNTRELPEISSSWVSDTLDSMPPGLAAAIREADSIRQSHDRQSWPKQSSHHQNTASGGLVTAAGLSNVPAIGVSSLQQDFWQMQRQMLQEHHAQLQQLAKQAADANRASAQPSAPAVPVIAAGARRPRSAWPWEDSSSAVGTGSNAAADAGSTHAGRGYQSAHATAPFATTVESPTRSPARHSDVSMRPNPNDDRPLRPAPDAMSHQDDLASANEPPRRVSSAAAGGAARRLNRDDRPVGLSGVGPPVEVPQSHSDHGAHHHHHSADKQKIKASERAPGARGSLSAAANVSHFQGTVPGLPHPATEERVAEAERKLLQLNMQKDAVSISVTNS